MNFMGCMKKYTVVNRLQHSSLHGRNYSHKESHGGVLRNRKMGRKRRPLFWKYPIHLVYKANRKALRTRSLRTHRNFLLITQIFGQYSKRFHTKILQISIQGDHIHALVRFNKRSQVINFLRVSAGQVAQQFEHKDHLMTDTRGVRVCDLWMLRPFTRIIKNWRAYVVVRNYIQLNEKEALGQIIYKRDRLKGLSSGEWKILWK